jgi:hypothetical protein
VRIRLRIRAVCWVTVSVRVTLMKPLARRKKEKKKGSTMFVYDVKSKRIRFDGRSLHLDCHT